MKITAFFYHHKKLINQEFRLYLDIKHEDQNRLTQPDLIVIMQNPGSCANPHKKYNTEISVDPDPTLHRIKSLLENFNNLKFIRVINLSDLVNPKGAEFFQNLPLIEKKIGKTHSLFDQSRNKTLNSLIENGSKVYFSCGVNKNCKDLLKVAIAVLKDKNVKILNTKKEFYHPLARPNRKLKNGWKFQAIKDLKKEFK